MKQTRKDIFGNVYTVETPKAKTFEQKLREAKAKQKYKQFQAEQRAKQIAQIKMSAERSRQGLAKIRAKAGQIKNRATDKRLTGIRAKLRGSIYSKE